MSDTKLTQQREHVAGEHIRHNCSHGLDHEYEVFIRFNIFFNQASFATRGRPFEGVLPLVLFLVLSPPPVILFSVLLRSKERTVA